MSKKTISGFSKLSKRGKIKWIVENFFKDPEAVTKELASYWHGNAAQQKVLDGFRIDIAYGVKRRRNKGFGIARLYVGA